MSGNNSNNGVVEPRIGLRNYLAETNAESGHKVTNEESGQEVTNEESGQENTFTRTTYDPVYLREITAETRRTYR